MNLGKCSKCGKSVYEIEGLTAGPPNKTKIYHKICFKCFFIYINKFLKN